MVLYPFTVPKTKTEGERKKKRCDISILHQKLRERERLDPYTVNVPKTQSDRDREKEVQLWPFHVRPKVVIIFFTTTPLD